MSLVAGSKLGPYEILAARSRRSPARGDVMIGQVLGPYTIVGRLGKGGMGEVYRARHAAPDYSSLVAKGLVMSGGGFSGPALRNHQACVSFTEEKRERENGGEGGIRTHGRVPLHTLSKRAPSTTRTRARCKRLA